MRKGSIISENKNIAGSFIQEPEEADLIRAAVAGDKLALTQLVQTHSGRIYNLANRIMRNPEDAEDVLQETFIIMIKKIKTFSGRSSVYTWLYRIAYNVALGKLRAKKRVDISISPHDPEFETLKGEQVYHWPDHLEQKINDEAFRNCLDKAMDSLPEHYRTVFVLRDLENLSTREAAEILEITEANVKVRLMRARLLLRDQLAHELKCVERL